jgi:beta-lactamase regulating signal transducer with metallopeptidase domain
MMTIEGMLSETIIRSLGWTLLHFTWQGTLVAILLRGALPLLRVYSARARYAAASCAMLLMLALPLATLFHLSRAPQSIGLDETVPVLTESGQGQALAALPADQSSSKFQAVTGSAALAASMPSQDGLDNWFARSLPWLVLIWLLGVLILSVRLVGGWKRAQRIRKHHMKPMPERWQEAKARLAQRMGVYRPVLLFESMLVEVPTVIGWLRPVILIPTSALAGLSPWHLEALLAHELAHVRRHDYLINLLQSATEILLFYHPATWWVSRQVRIERENDCDDRAVRATGDVLVYARALAEIEILRSSSGSPAREQLAMAADSGSLLLRIRRLVASPEQTRRSSPLLVAVALFVTFFALTAGARTILSMNVEMPERMIEEQIKPLENGAVGESAHTLPLTNQPAQSEVAALIARDETGKEDAEVRRVAMAALGKHEGTVIVMEPRTGRVYAIVNQEWALRRGWNPASTIKLVTGLAGIEEKLIEPTARLRFSPRSIPLNLSEALAQSNSDYFKFVGERVGFDRLMNYARRLGLGERTGINYEGEMAGQLPADRSGIDVGRLSAYGDRIQVTPIQLATLVSAIANGGVLVVPRVPEATQASAGFETQVRQRLDVPQESLQQLAAGMSAAVRYGTGKPAYNPALAVAGKTGTGFDRGTKLGLFASYAPVDKPSLVVVVAIQGAEESGPVAARVAGQIYRALKPHAL